MVFISYTQHFRVFLVWSRFRPFFHTVHPASTSPLSFLHFTQFACVCPWFSSSSSPSFSYHMWFYQKSRFFIGDLLRKSQNCYTFRRWHAHEKKSRFIKVLAAMKKWKKRKEKNMIKSENGWQELPKKWQFTRKLAYHQKAKSFEATWKFETKTRLISRQTTRLMNKFQDPTIVEIWHQKPSFCVLETQDDLTATRKFLAYEIRIVFLSWRQNSILYKSFQVKIERVRDLSRFK